MLTDWILCWSYAGNNISCWVCECCGPVQLRRHSFNSLLGTLTCWTILLAHSFYFLFYLLYKSVCSFYINVVVFSIVGHPVDPACSERLCFLFLWMLCSVTFICVRQFVYSALCWSLYLSCLPFKCAFFLKCGFAKLYGKGRFLYKSDINVPWNYMVWSMIMNFVTSSSF